MLTLPVQLAAARSSAQAHTSGSQDDGSDGTCGGTFAVAVTANAATVIIATAAHTDGVKRPVILPRDTLYSRWNEGLLDEISHRLVGALRPRFIYTYITDLLLVVVVHIHCFNLGIKIRPNLTALFRHRRVYLWISLTYT